VLVGDPLLWDQDTSKHVHGVLQDKDTVFDVQEITKITVQPIPTSLPHTTQTQHVHNMLLYSISTLALGYFSNPFSTVQGLRYGREDKCY
jgi:hypothetical protein